MSWPGIVGCRAKGLFSEATWEDTLEGSAAGFPDAVNLMHCLQEPSLKSEKLVRLPVSSYLSGGIRNWGLNAQFEDLSYSPHKECRNIELSAHQVMLSQCCNSIVQQLVPNHLIKVGPLINWQAIISWICFHLQATRLTYILQCFVYSCVQSSSGTLLAVL